MIAVDLFEPPCASLGFPPAPAAPDPDLVEMHRTPCPEALPVVEAKLLFWSPPCRTRLTSNAKGRK